MPPVNRSPGLKLVEGPDMQLPPRRAVRLLKSAFRSHRLPVLSTVRIYAGTKRRRRPSLRRLWNKIHAASANRATASITFGYSHCA